MKHIQRLLVGLVIFVICFVALVALVFCIHTGLMWLSDNIEVGPVIQTFSALLFLYLAYTVGRQFLERKEGD